MLRYSVDPIMVKNMIEFFKQKNISLKKLIFEGGKLDISEEFGKELS